MALLEEAGQLGPAEEVEAKRLEVLASLMFSRGDSEEAKPLLEKALQLREQIADRRGLLDCLIQMAVCVSDFDPVEALQLTARAARLCSPYDFRTTLAIHHNAAEFLLLAGEPGEAFKTVYMLEPLYAQVEEFRTHPQRWHLAAKTARALKFFSMSETEYRRAIDEYSRRELFHGWAVASVELAELLASRGRTEDARLLLEQALPAFDRCGVSEVDVRQLSKVSKTLMRK